MERYQLVRNTLYKELETHKYMVIRVECRDDDPRVIIRPLDIIPVHVAGVSIQDVKDELRTIMDDILAYPVVTTEKLDALFLDYLDTQGEFYDIDFPEENYEVQLDTHGIVYEDEDDIEDLTSYYSTDKVIDLVDYMNNNLTRR